MRIRARVHACKRAPRVSSSTGRPRAQPRPQGRGHAINAPLCDGGTALRVSARAPLLRPAQLRAAPDSRVRAALAAARRRHGPCDAAACAYALLAAPAALCPAGGCAVPAGGRAVLVAPAAWPAPAARGPGRATCTGPDCVEVELGAWDGAGLEGPGLARVDARSGYAARSFCMAERTPSLTLSPGAGAGTCAG
jgi:hypothetical protein